MSATPGLGALRASARVLAILQREGITLAVPDEIEIAAAIEEETGAGELAACLKEVLDVLRGYQAGSSDAEFVRRFSRAYSAIDKEGH